MIIKKIPWFDEHNYIPGYVSYPTRDFRNKKYTSDNNITSSLKSLCILYENINFNHNIDRHYIFHLI